MAEGGQDLPDRNGNPSLESIIAEQGHGGQITKESLKSNVARYAALATGDHVTQHFTNSNIYVAAGDIHVAPPYQSPENKLDQIRLKLQAENGFLAKTKLHLRNKIGDSKRFSGHPTIMVVDMTGTGAGISEPANRLGRDIEKISLDQIHDAEQNKCSNHVTILGEAGAGKTTLSKMYCLAVEEGNVKTLNNIQLVHFVPAATLQHRSMTTAFNLLFTEQMTRGPDTKLSIQEEEAGQEWLSINSAKMLIVIDGLDQCLEEFGREKYPIVTATTAAKANDIIANIMSKNIWPDARVLTTTRWNIYWYIEADQKSDKVVGLRGLDDKTLREIAFSNSIDGDKFLDALRNAPHEMLSLCRNPMFFNYMTTIYQKDPSTLPDNLSGLVAAVFRAYLSPSSVKHYDDITRLAYNAMHDNIFVFPESYLIKHKVDANELNKFLSTGANLEDGRNTPSPFNKYAEFSHQTMQEFCCAMHVLNLTGDEIKEFVTNQLNETRMQLTRQLFYGLILNDEVTKPMEKYLANRNTSIPECRKILMDHFHILIENRTIQNIQTIMILNECGHETIQEIKQKVDNIILNQPGPLNGHILLATMAERLSPLQVVYCDHFYLEPPVIEHFVSIRSHTKMLQVRTVAIQDTSLTENNLAEYLKLLRLFNCRELLFYQCHLSKEHDEVLTRTWGRLGIQLYILSVIDESMNEEGYEVIAHIANLSQCSELLIQFSSLTKTKLQGLLRGCSKHDTKLPNITIIDESMKEEGYEELTHIMKMSDCNELVLQKCRLTGTKLNGILSGCRIQNIQLPTLVIFDESMNKDEYQLLADVLKVVHCQMLQLTGCCLTKTKLRGLRRGCRNQNVQLQQLFILDPDMPTDAYCDVAGILKDTKCPTMQFKDCNLSKQDIQCFGAGCRENQVILPELTIAETHSVANHDDVSALCDLMTCAVFTLSIHYWKINPEGIRRLEDTLHRRDSKTLLLRLPDGVWRSK